MKLIKLNAIDSTNEYIKKNKDVFYENELCVFTFNQTNGNGQRGNKWISEPGQNICISFLFRDLNINIKDQFKLNMLVSLKIIKILRNFKINNLKIKWPNDILADNKKICGILIESFFKKNRVKDAVIGFGINVNQFDFGAVKNATSFFLIKKTFQDLFPMSKAIIKEFSDFNYEVINKTTSELKFKYLKSLYGLNIYNKFNVSEDIINAKIVDIRAEGQLVLEIDGVKKEFINQQIKYIN